MMAQDGLTLSSGGFGRRLDPSCGLDGAIDFCSMTGDYRIELLLDFTENTRRIDSRKVSIDVFVNDLDRGKQFR